LRTILARELLSHLVAHGIDLIENGLPKLLRAGPFNKSGSHRAVSADNGYIDADPRERFDGARRDLAADALGHRGCRQRCPRHRASDGPVVDGSEQEPCSAPRHNERGARKDRDRGDKRP